MPSLIVLHGATGVEFANRFIANLAHQISTQGFVVHLVHYFDRTGSTFADDRTIKRSSGIWLETVRDAVRYIREHRPKAKIGIFGHSLGGYLAAAETVLHGEIAAAVILSGGLDEGSTQKARYAAPMLILHGTSDTRVPFSEAVRLESVMQGVGRAPEVHIYPAQGHILDWASYGDVLQRSVEFLRQHLG